MGAELLGLPPLRTSWADQCPLCRAGYVLTGAPSPVPEPATLAFWGLVGMAVVAHGQRSWTDRAAA